MRAAVSCAMALLAVAALSAVSSAQPNPSLSAWAGGVPPARRTDCAAKADQTSIAAHSKANSFAPHSGPHSRVYGVPIQSRILKSRPKKKPQLTSSPLSDSTGAKTPSGG
jgi:hypothetical protein